MSKPRSCPICKKPRSTEFAPFCSIRCKDRDLARWFGDGYAVPGPPASPDDLARDMARELGGGQGEEDDR